MCAGVRLTACSKLGRNSGSMHQRDPLPTGYYIMNKEKEKWQISFIIIKKYCYLVAKAAVACRAGFANLKRARKVQPCTLTTKKASIIKGVSEK